MLGFCGIDCTECGAYKATMKGDIAGLKSVAAKFSGHRDPEAWVCLGCLTADDRFLADYCATCKIRLCAKSKGHVNCAACEGFENCAVLHDFIDGESKGLATKMGILRNAFLARVKQLGA